MKALRKERVRLEKIVGGGQALGRLADGRKVFVWGGLPGELVDIQLTKLKSNMAEAVVTFVIEPSPERINPKDPESYLSTSPWQIMSFDAETKYKQLLIGDAFTLHHVALPDKTRIYSDDTNHNYRNKVEFSWYGSTCKRVTRCGAAPTSAQREAMREDGADRAPGPAESDLRSDSGAGVYDGSGREQLDIAFYRRGTQGKVVVDGTSLARKEINQLARMIRDTLSAKGVEARQLKTLLIRCDQKGNTVWQLYVKDEQFDALGETDATSFPAQGGEVIYSDPKSPASRITKRLVSFGNPVLTDTLLDVPFRYATEGFFQVNIPVYEQVLEDMRVFVEGKEADSPQQAVDRKSQDTNKRVTRGGAAPDPNTTATKHLQPERALMYAQGEPGVKPLSGGMYEGSGQVVDLYSGVGTIGLTIGGDNVTLVEVNEDAVREMRANIRQLHKNAEAVLAPSEKALEYITSEAIVIVDPPRAGLHTSVVQRLLDVTPPRIIYLSCNPVTQARDAAALLEKYRVVHHRGYNFFPRTPHIEHLLVLDVVQPK